MTLSRATAWLRSKIYCHGKDECGEWSAVSEHISRWMRNPSALYITERYEHILPSRRAWMRWCPGHTNPDKGDKGHWEYATSKQMARIVLKERYESA